MLIFAIVVAVVLALLIFTLTIIALSSILKFEKREIELGNRDLEIKKTYLKKQHFKIVNILISIINYIVLLTIGVGIVTAVIYKVSGDQFKITDNTCLVIASDSMKEFCDDSYKETLLSYNENIKETQFKTGDIVTFETVNEDDSLVLYDVYAYKNNKGQLITHRYLGETSDGKLIFKGDNVTKRDSYVNRNQVILHSTNFKISYIGFVILFVQSSYGLYTFLSCIALIIVSDIYLSKYNKMLKNRRVFLNLEKSKYDKK